MAHPVKPIPDGYHAVTPYLTFNDAAEAIDFYKKVFHATEKMRMPDPGGKIMHAELQIGDSVIMLADESPQRDNKSPHSIGGTPVGFCIYVKDVDATVKTATEAGAKLRKPIEDQFYGDRSGIVQDPFGHMWTIATHIEDVTPDEMCKRMQKIGAGV